MCIPLFLLLTPSFLYCSFFSETKKELRWRVVVIDTISSPRSTIVTSSSNMSSSGGGTDKKGKPDTEPDKEATDADPPVDTPKDDPSSPIITGVAKATPEHPESPALTLHPNAYPQLYPPHLTPQQGGGYYIYQQPQVTPEPHSPAGTNGMYDAASFRHHHFLSNPFAGYGQGVIPPPPLSPRMGSMGSLPPPSPLFPRVAANNAGRLSPGGNGGAPPSPAPYLSPPLGPSAPSYGAVYQTYSYGGAYNNGGNGTGSEDSNAWSDRYVHFKLYFLCVVNSHQRSSQCFVIEVNRMVICKRPHNCM